MAKKQEESAAKRKPSAASESTAAKPKKATAKSAGVKTKSAAHETTAAKKAASAKKTSVNDETEVKSAIAAKASATSAKKSVKPRKAVKKAEEPVEIAATLTGPVEDPLGDTTDGEAQRLLVHENEGEAEEEFPEAEAEGEAGSDEELEDAREPRPEPHLERLQKVLSQAGIASRRHAEEMIVAGRVMVNGQVVTQLGAKADAARDHIRVDGKMIQGAERHRTFVLNKPKGFVTTVSDPEGRPTVMQFFEKMKERLYPVGRLDYQSEGLLLMTNDGELANGLTRAASGVEKTYLVKVAGHPTEEELEQLRGGVSIDREQAGSGRVRTAPASVQLVRTGDNPWYEVILTEGRNRELRKMFQAVGHFVEKIRRVGYGPLVLDVEPGQFRELSDEEVTSLRLTAEGKLKPRRPKSLALVPKEAGRGAAGSRPGTSFDKRGPGRGPAPRGEAMRGAPAARPFRGREERGKPAGERGGFENRGFGGKREGGEFKRREGFKPREGGQFKREGFKPREGQGFGRPAFKPGDRPGGERPERRGEGGREGFARPREDRGGVRPQGERPGFDKPRFDKPRFDKPRFDKPRFDKPRFDNSRPERSASAPPRFDRPRPARPGFERREERPANRGPREGQRSGGRPEQGRPFGGERPRFEKPRFERPERTAPPGFSIEEVQPGREFRRRESGPNPGRADRGGAGRPSSDRSGDRGERSNRYPASRFDRDRGGSGRGGGEWRPREGGERPARPAGAGGGAPRGGASRGGAPRFGGPGRTGGGNPRRGPGGAPGGSRKPGFRGRPGGGPPRRDRG
jgi:23S rRNA pseudouridine2605 synthase